MPNGFRVFYNTRNYSDISVSGSITTKKLIRASHGFFVRLSSGEVNDLSSDGKFQE